MQGDSPDSTCTACNKSGINPFGHNASENQQQKRKQPRHKVNSGFAESGKQETEIAIPRSLGANQYQLVVHRYAVDFSRSLKAEPYNTIAEASTELRRGLKTNSVLRAASEAAALANFANRYSVPELKVEASLRYADALQQVRTALRYPRRIRSNDLLISVVLLAMFEVNTE